MKTSKEYRRSFPWFSASLGIVAVGCVITLFVTGQLNAGRGDFGSFLTRAFERVLSGQDPLAIDNLHTVTFADAGDEDGVVISGYPSFASTTVPLVRDQEIEALRLVLTGEQDISERATVALRVTVNGRRVIERVLSPGRREFRWVFDLTEEFEGASQARVAFQLLGDLPEDLCHNDRSMGAVIAFNGDSSAEMELAGPLNSLRDVMALTARDVAVALPEGDDWFELGVRLAARMARAGYHVDLISLGEAAEAVETGGDVILTGAPEALRRAGFSAAPGGAEAGASLWRRAGVTSVAVTDPSRFETVRFLTSALLPIARASEINPVLFAESRGPQPGLTPVTNFGLDTSIQQVTEGRVWRFDYTLSELPNGRLPEALRVDMRIPEGPEDFNNLAHVELNGELIESVRLDAGAENVFDVTLPARLQALSNEVSIALQRHRDLGGCEISARRYPVQLTELSGLVTETGAPSAGFTSLPEAFHQGLLVRFPEEMPGASRLIAGRLAAETIARFVPEATRLQFEFARTENGQSEMIELPFIAVNNTPSNAAAPMRIFADRLVIENGASGAEADVRALADLSVFQAVAAARPDPRDLETILFVPGLVVHAIDEPPALAAARLGRERLAILHADGEVVRPQTGRR
ncbi:MAG: hypothetical protein AAFX09_03145 [Pseudomonadota bacterium]